MKTFNDYLEMDGSIAFNVAIYNSVATIESHSAYTEICGSFYEAVYAWADHNIYSIDEEKTNKNTWFRVFFGQGEKEQIFYIPNWVLEVQPKNWAHAKNLFCKYLTAYNK
jgi:hypothetical protein